MDADSAGRAGHSKLNGRTSRPVEYEDFIDVIVLSRQQLLNVLRVAPPSANVVCVVSPVLYSHPPLLTLPPHPSSASLADQYAEDCDHDHFSWLAEA